MEKFLSQWTTKSLNNNPNIEIIEEYPKINDNESENSGNLPITDDTDDVDSERDESAAESESQTTSHQKKQKKRYQQKFKLEWKGKFGEWAISTADQKIFCNVCKMVIAGGSTHINRHSKTLKHIRMMKVIKSTPKITEVVKSDDLLRFHKQIQVSEMLLIMFIAEHNLPFLLLDHLTKLIPKVCPDSEIAKSLKVNRKKGTYMCTTVIVPEQLFSMRKDLNENVYSLIIDETTDVSSTKSLAIVARYYKSKINERFLGLVKVENSSAQGIFDSIIKFLRDHNISTEKLLGFAADNASTMMGNKNGVQVKFKSINPHIFVLGCICHSFSLCSSAACAKLPTSMEQLVRDICNYFSNSYSRLSHLKECQIFMNLKPHRMLKLAQTRWLSLQAVIDRILEQYEALDLFFTNECFENQKLQNPNYILLALKNPIFKSYFLFSSYILDIVNKLNLEFQSASLRIHKLSEHISNLYRTIIRNFIQKNVIDTSDLNTININNPFNYLPIEKIYVGAKCQMFTMNNNIQDKDINNFRVHCLNFYIELANQIKTRFTFKDPVLELIKSLDPKYVFSGEVETLVPLIDRFPSLTGNIEMLDSEWRLLQDTKELKNYSHEPPLEFWDKIFTQKNGLEELMFPHLKICISGLLCLPHSSTAAERIFSSLALIKQKTRNRLLIKTCDALLHTKELLFQDYCFNFKPSLSLLQRKCNYDSDKNEIIDDTEELTF